MIQCPYCISEVDPAAVVCRSCGRDLAGQMYMLRRIVELEDSVRALKDQLQAPASMADRATTKTSTSKVTAASRTHTNDWLADAGHLLTFLLLPDVLLVLGHHLLVLSWNRGPAWLLILSLVLPVVFGFGALVSGVRGFIFWLIAFLANAVLAVCAMSLDTYWSTLTPYSSSAILPSTLSEWVQDLQFAASLFLGFLSGSFAALLFLRARNPAHPALAVSRSGAVILAQQFRLTLSEGVIERAGKYVSSVGAIVSAIGALYLGLQRV